ncbi:MAG TPA: TolC family outer membrane protein [Acetobacteraceae bacterium]|nr:TolC family outer membrane protein [Acetobacteraceae bacterium]
MPRTLQQALAAAYANNPVLLQERANLRSVDEGVPTALAGWRPQVSVTTSAGYGDGDNKLSTQSFGGQNTTVVTRTNRVLFSAAATLSQPLYRGGHTTSSTHQAVNSVLSERAKLIATEEQVFSDTINAYVGVIENKNLLLLNISNEQVLARQLQATNDRFRVGEITRTDVAQAEAALAGARAQRETAEGNLQTARATYAREVGMMPPDDLVEPQPLRLPVATEHEAVETAIANNPNVIAALFSDAAAKDAVDVAFSALMPQVSLEGTAFRNDNESYAHYRNIGAQATINLSVPIYQGGSEYAAVRQARQSEQKTQKAVDDARRQARQQAVEAWETLIAARATVDSTRAQIRSNQIALDGVQREAIVGSRTTLDVLNAQQALLNSRVTLVQNLASVVNASYNVAGAVGRLTARDLSLNVPLYDETAYYNAVRDRLWGTGDRATNQPGR